ncbi:AfsR/SARP family transcriptional regulator [Lentzea tibetensis]|uniref:AfsR/SARP family transcriptional regulator n=1 Tax=Lentzea tibetensis TaxID=2591470 RepID=A0A563EVM0_9PSEU|nr:AfsR/SARP family transcriptional regulator [Lentzea tibetensis]TWP51750.1 AfsR/SARP family transcriptional regulator [Lentzea tibetensis]
MATGWRFGVLGPLEVCYDGRLVLIGAAKQRVLLASLLIAANQVVPTGTLVARLWGESPPRGHRNTLQNHVLRLRRVLGEAGSRVPVHTRPGGYVVQVGHDELDLITFQRMLSAARVSARAGDLARMSCLLHDALGLWRGPALADVPSDALQREVVPALVENRLRAAELRIGADISLGDHHEVLAELHELTCSNPLREPLWALRMLALYRCGRQAEALACYHEVRGHLAGQLGIDPGAELSLLHQRMLTADPGLVLAK